MSTGAVILTAAVTAVVTLLVMESYQTTPWLAHKLMQWSVRVRYADNPHRAKVRGEELTGLLEDLPTLFKLPTAGWFLLRALAYRLERGGETPMDQILRIQLKDRLLWLRVRRHWACLLRVLAQTFAVVIVAFVLSQLLGGGGDDFWMQQSVLWYLATAAVLRFAWKVLKWWSEVLIVTDKFFLITSGIIVRKTSMLPLTKVTDLSYLRTAGGRVLNYGTLRVKSTEHKQDFEKFEYVPVIEGVVNVIRQLISREKVRDPLPSKSITHEGRLPQL